MRRIVIRATDLVKYEGNQRILDYCCFSLYEHEILGIVGLDGSGIATLAGVLEGRVQVDKGSISMYKKKLELSSRPAIMRQGIFSMSRHSSLVPQLSVMENIYLIKPFAWKDFKISRKRMEQTVMALFEKCGVSVPLRKPVYQLSQLERDMAEICKAVLYEAKVLVLYEVSEGYTNQEWDVLRDLLIRIRNRGISVIFIHSDLNKILKIADRVDIIARGFFCTEFWADDYTDEMLKVLYQSDRFYFMHKSLELNQIRIEKNREILLKVEKLFLQGLQEPVNLTIPKGMTVGVVAAGGKASELAHILGRRRKGEGLFIYRNRIYGGKAWKRIHDREVVYVGSQFWKKNLFYNLTIGENIVLRVYPKLRRGFWLDKKMIQFAVKEYCGIFGLDEEIMGQKPQDVGEELLKEIFWVSLAVSQPKLLVMEEPFYALDEVGRLYMYKFIMLLKKEGCVVVICGKNQGEIRQFCDKTYVLS